MKSRPVLPVSFSRHIRTARELADERRRAPEEVRIATASEGFDRLLEGGLERGAMVALYEEAYAYCSDVMVQNMLFKDAEEGIGAFVEKREPKWEDR